MTKHPIKSLYVFDIDDTLFRTSARARIVNTKGQVKYLSSECCAYNAEAAGSIPARTTKIL